MESLEYLVGVLYTLSVSISVNAVLHAAITTCKSDIRHPTSRMSLSPIPICIPPYIQIVHAVKDTCTSYESLGDLFRSSENYLSRLNIYTGIP